ncbi:hypothetical protein D9758_011902 [Tetrapyrgos nigripes]|uniref:ABM domain-containing protein n=1 Tax=Tetrapyrgos nigripes TaxID=182062 RepID=A0A8H5CRM0_9AGAR|nr:hypothetical protein D9758_011902 [Tetrapyrgos nigripes]
MLFNSLLLSSLLLFPAWVAAIPRQYDVSNGTQSCEDLLPDASAFPDTTSSGKFMFFIRVQVIEGKQAELEDVISNIDNFVKSGAEPDTLTHRSVRELGQDGNPTGFYTVIEEFTDKEAFITHLLSPAGCRLLREGPSLIASQNLTLVDEF